MEALTAEPLSLVDPAAAAFAAVAVGGLCDWCCSGAPEEALALRDGSCLADAAE